MTVAQGKKEGRAVAYAVQLDVQGLRAWDLMNVAISEEAISEASLGRNVIAAYGMEAHEWLP
jgi:hypothetical protein